MDERKVIVRDKTGKLLAVFSNKTPAHDSQSKKNLMISPTIDIVQNGESTLSFQMFVNSEKWQAIKNPENLYYCNGRVYTPLNAQSYTYSGEVVNVMLVELWYLLSYKYVQAHNVNTKVEAIDEHTVKILPKTNERYKLTVNGVEYNDSEVKDSRGVIMPRGSAGYALWAVLRGTDWKLGVCDVLPEGFDASEDYGTFNVETDMKSVLENIQFIRELYGGILDWDSQTKTLNLRDENLSQSDFNSWKGYSIRKGKNLSEPPSIVYDNDIITRLYPLGNGNLNIKKVNNDKNYIDNFSYTNSVYEGYIQNANIYDTGDDGGQKTLKFWAEQKLKELCKPRKTISYSVIDTRAVPELSHESVDINHIVKAYYPDSQSGKEVFEYLRVNHISYNWFFPGSDSTIEVGDKVANTVELFHQIYKKSENSADPDGNGHWSGEDIYIEIPEEYWDLFGGQFGYTSLQNITGLYAQKQTENSNAVASLRVYADETFATITSFTTFQQWTQEGFKQSNTRIDQVSSALSAQIDLEAKHHEESLKYTQDSVANLKLYVDGDFATATLNAAYAYADAEVKEVSNALASFESYADRTYATIKQLASYATYDDVGELISQSEASIKAYADERYASISLETKVGGINTEDAGYIIISPEMISLSVYDGGSIAVDQYVTFRGYSTRVYSERFQVSCERITLSASDLYIKGRNVYWEDGFLKGD